MEYVQPVTMQIWRKAAMYQASRRRRHPLVTVPFLLGPVQKHRIEGDCSNAETVTGFTAPNHCPCLD